MTVSSSTRRAGPFNGNDVTTAFPFTFKVFAGSDVAVYLTDPDGVQTLLPSGYTVTLNGDQDASPGGTVNYPTAGDPLATGYKLDLLGDVPFTQGTDITNLGRFLPQVVENALDKLTIIGQQLLERFARAVTFPVGDTATNTLPTATARANKALIFDAEGGVTVSDDDYNDQLANVTAQATAAAGSAAAALASQTAAEGSASEAADHEAQTLAYLQAYRATSYGALAADPAVDPNGNPPTIGDEYFNTTSNLLKRFNGATWQASDINTANLAASGGSSLVGFVQPGSGAVATTVQAQLRTLPRNVLNYGAIGDGVADDKTAFHAVRDAAGVGGVVFVPAGTYLLSGAALNVADQTWIFDPNAEVRSTNNATTFALTISASGVTIEGGKFNNQAASGDAYAEVGSIKVQSADAVTIRRGQYQKSRGPCILAEGCNRLTIRENRFTDTWYAAAFVRPLNADITDIDVSDNEVRNTTAFAGYDYGINVHNDAGSLYKVTNVRIARNQVTFPVVATTFPVAIEVYGGPAGAAGAAQNVVVSANEVRGSGIGISLSGCTDASATGNSVDSAYLYGIESVNPYNVAITGNTITGGSTSNTRRGVSVSEAGSGVVVSGNAIRRTVAAAVYLSSVGTAATVAGNSIDVTSTHGIIALSSSRISITGNVLEGNNTGKKAIMLDKTDRCTITGNTAANWTENGVLLYGDAAVTLNRVAVANNIWINVANSISVATQLSGGAAIGRFVSYIGNFSDVDTTYRRDVLDVLNNRIDFLGAATPEGVWSAGPGSIFRRTDGGAATSFYVKESGTGNTGWVGK